MSAVGCSHSAYPRRDGHADLLFYVISSY